MFSPIRLVFLLLLTAFVLASCSSKSLIRPGDTIEIAYAKAMDQYERGRYGDAARAFETVLSIARGTEFASDAQFYLAESYFNNREYLIAATEYRRHYTNYPRVENRQISEFKEALSYYRITPRYNLDQTNGRQALELFDLFVSRYPNSESVGEAMGYIDDLRNRQARKMYVAADLYMRMRQYNAAAIYYGLVLDNYPETLWAEQALVEQINAYIIYADNSVAERQPERYQMAIDSYQRYIQVFPRGENRSRAEAYYDVARVNHARASQQLSSIE
ncbi:MAG: outer membrane protein assembly factor BamD [Cyclonatronaceae bacterium]